MAPPDLAAAPEGESDDALIVRFAAGDQSAARELASRHTPRLLALGYRMLRDQAEAEDIAQEAMMRAWRVAPDWRTGEAKLSTWLHKVALNLCYDRLRKRPTAPLEDAPEPMDETPSVQATMESDDRAGRVREAIAALPDRQRAAIQLRHFEERGNDETAEILGVSVEAVESLLSRGRRALKRALRAEHDLLMEG